MLVGHLTHGLRRCGVAGLEEPSEGGPVVRDRPKQGVDVLLAALHGQRDARRLHAHARGGGARSRLRPDGDRLCRIGASLDRKRAGLIRLDAPRQRPCGELVLRGRDGFFEPVDVAQKILTWMRMSVRALDGFPPLTLGLFDRREGLQQRYRVHFHLGSDALLLRRLKPRLDIRLELHPGLDRRLRLRPRRERGGRLGHGLPQPWNSLLQQLAAGETLMKDVILPDELTRRANLVFERCHPPADVVEPALQFEDAIAICQQLLPGVPGNQDEAYLSFPRIRNPFLFTVLRLGPVVFFVPAAKSPLDLLGELLPQTLLIHVSRRIGSRLKQVADVPQFAGFLLFPDRFERAFEFRLAREQDVPKCRLAVDEHLPEPLLDGVGIGYRRRAVTESAHLAGTPFLFERPDRTALLERERDRSVIAVRQRQPRLHTLVELRGCLIRGREQCVKDRLPQRGLAQLIWSMNHHQGLRQVP